jgi:hypothetical protein
MKKGKVVQEAKVVIDFKKVRALIEKINNKEIDIVAEVMIKSRKNGQRSPVYKGVVVEKNSMSRLKGLTLILCSKEYSSPGYAVKRTWQMLNKIIAILQQL